MGEVPEAEADLCGSPMGIGADVTLASEPKVAAAV